MTPCKPFWIKKNHMIRSNAVGYARFLLSSHGLMSSGFMTVLKTVNTTVNPWLKETKASSSPSPGEIIQFSGVYGSSCLVKILAERKFNRIKETLLLVKWKLLQPKSFPLVMILRCVRGDPNVSVKIFLSNPQLCVI